MLIVSSKARKKYKIFFNFKTLLTLLILFFVFIIIFDSKTYVAASQKAMLLWANNVLPSLYIFFVFSKLLTNLDTLKILSNFLSPLMRKLFNTTSESSYLYFLSILSGFPVGAMLIKDAYLSGKITIDDAHKITTFSALTGPAFIFGTIGATMLKNSLAGSIIYISHFVSSIINGIVFRNYKSGGKFSQIKKQLNKQNSNILASSISSSINSILIVGGYIVFFYIILEILINIKILPLILYPINKLFKIDLLPVITGLIEVTKGISDISRIFPLKTAIPIISFLVSFGGICIHLQSFYYLKECNIKYNFYLFQKFTHATLSLLISLPLCLLV